jgi:hypothetical protein
MTERPGTALQPIREVIERSGGWRIGQATRHRHRQLYASGDRTSPYAIFAPPRIVGSSRRPAGRAHWPDLADDA